MHRASLFLIGWLSSWFLNPDVSRIQSHLARAGKFFLLQGFWGIFFLLALLTSRILQHVSHWSQLGHDDIRLLKNDWSLTGYLNISMIGIVCRLLKVYWWHDLCSGRRGLGNGRPFIRFDFGLPPLPVFHSFHWLDFENWITEIGKLIIG